MTFTTAPGILTKTHRKCAKCGEWKEHNQYSKDRGRCRPCVAEDSAKRYRALTPEKLDAVLKKGVQRRKRRRRGETQSRLAEARGAIKIMRNHGISSYTQMQEFCGVTRDNLSHIDNGRALFVKDETLKKLYDAVEVLIGVA